MQQQRETEQVASAVEQLAASVQEVARHAQRLREVFARLGLAYQRQTRRVQGHRVDRARIPDAVLRGEVRILQARRLMVDTDLFLGVVVDCSGSMQGDCMHKARLFATLVARAVEGLAGVELRVLGFTDSLVYDAGAAHRCAAHNLPSHAGTSPSPRRPPEPFRAQAPRPPFPPSVGFRP